MGEREQRHGKKEKEHMHGDMGSNGHRGSDGHRGRISKSMGFTMPSVFPSMPKGDIVEILVVIDDKP
jgi:hypothetical protein